MNNIDLGILSDFVYTSEVKHERDRNSLSELVFID